MCCAILACLCPWGLTALASMLRPALGQGWHRAGHSHPPQIHPVGHTAHSKGARGSNTPVLEGRGSGPPRRALRRMLRVPRKRTGWAGAGTHTAFWACGRVPWCGTHLAQGLGAYLQSPLVGVGPSEGGLMVVSACRVVKEEISADNARLPCFNGRVVSWVSLWDIGTGHLARVGMVPELQGGWAQASWV